MIQSYPHHTRGEAQPTLTYGRLHAETKDGQHGQQSRPIYILSRLTLFTTPPDTTFPTSWFSFRRHSKTRLMPGMLARLCDDHHFMKAGLLTRLVPGSASRRKRVRAIIRGISQTYSECTHKLRFLQLAMGSPLCACCRSIRVCVPAYTCVGLSICMHVCVRVCIFA